MVSCSIPIILIMIAALSGANMGINQVFMTMAFSSITVFNPLTTVFFMRTYRDIVLRKVFRKRAVEEEPMATRVADLSRATVLPSDLSQANAVPASHGPSA